MVLLLKRSTTGSRISSTTARPEEVAGRCMSLPVYPEMTDASVRLVAEIVKEVLVG